MAQLTEHEMELIDRYRKGEVVTEKQIENLLNSSNPEVRESLAKQGIVLDRLVHDENVFVRAAVARQGYGLDTLVSDEDPYVRATVARMGYGLDILRNDTSLEVQDAVWDYERGMSFNASVADILSDAKERSLDANDGLGVSKSDYGLY